MCLFTSARTVAIVFARSAGSAAMYCAGVLTFAGGFKDSSSSRTKCITERLKARQSDGRRISWAPCRIPVRPFVHRLKAGQLAHWKAAAGEVLAQVAIHPPDDYDPSAEDQAGDRDRPPFAYASVEVPVAFPHKPCYSPVAITQEPAMSDAKLDLLQGTL